MTPETLFSISNTVALVGWIFLILVPRWKWTTQFITPFLIPLLLGLVYVTLIGTNFGSSGGDFSSLEGVKTLFANDYVLVAGWVHYLVFDLFVGSWILRDSQRREINHFIIIPCLLGSFLFGPAGLVLYFAIRGALRKLVFIDESSSFIPPTPTPLQTHET